MMGVFALKGVWGLMGGRQPVLAWGVDIPSRLWRVCTMWNTCTLRQAARGIFPGLFLVSYSMIV